MYDEGFQVAGEFAFVCPKVVISFRDPNRGVREIAPAPCISEAADMVNVTMRADNVIDCGRTDLRLVEAAKETTGRRAERLRSAHATVEHDEPAARIQEQHVLLEDKIVSRQEVVSERLGQFLLSRPFQRSGWLSQRQRPVRDHGCLKLADHEAIEIGDLAADDWGAGLAGWNAKASGRSKSAGRRAKKHSASGDRRVGHMHFLPGLVLPAPRAATRPPRRRAT